MSLRFCLLLAVILVACVEPLSGDDRLDDGSDASLGPDSGASADGGPVFDGGPTTDVGPAPNGHRAIGAVSSGGGEAASENFTVRISIGGPAPMGTSQSPNYRLIIAPPAP